MDTLVKLWEQPIAEEIYMLIGWHQWADAGSISSGLPQYLIQATEARQIGEILSDGFYLFQLPGAHHFLRPEIKLEEGYRLSLEKPQNVLYYTGDEQRGLVIFLGEEPHLNVDRYAEAVLSAAEALGVKRIIAVGGVYGAMPYDQEREVSCVYSLRSMKEELSRYAVRFSNYEGGATIGSYLVDSAEHRGLEFATFYAFVPSYDFAEFSNVVQVLRIENDYTAWYELLRRFNHMFGLNIDLTELRQHSEELQESMDSQIEELDHKMPELQLRSYMAKIAEDFVARPFTPPLGDMWEKALGNLLKDIDEE